MEKSEESFIIFWKAYRIVLYFAVVFICPILHELVKVAVKLSAGDVTPDSLDVNSQTVIN